MKRLHTVHSDAAVHPHGHYVRAIEHGPTLAPYMTRCIERPAFERALEAQMTVFKAHEPTKA